ncbi:rna 3terminal phosphate cyclase [Diaporthe eres]|uniref:2EXR domain-containing protein n=1 Tax=Diaporthe vaccinii TaxID=105482 RepID=A0ABR4EDX6_9PEZI|nr:rna 3terminal phosphate cyclase [Diaporthe eres]
MATTSPSPLGALSRFPLEIRRIIYDFTLDHSERDYHFEVEANKVLRVPEATVSLPRPTPAMAHVCGEMRDHFLESHTKASFTCAVYNRTCTEGGCWEEKADPREPQLAAKTGWFNRRSDRVTFSRHELPAPPRPEFSASPPLSDEDEDEDKDEQCDIELYEKQERQLLLSVETYHVTDFVKLVEAERSAFVQKNRDEETRVYPRDFYDIIHQGPAVLVRRSWCA